ncbi:MAG: bifunctional molybdenum cofactor biosynthesis protein MoaC/MoaB [Planctomycetota bacterium]
MSEPTPIRSSASVGENDPQRPSGLSHLGVHGAKMVDVGTKPQSVRRAVAKATVAPIGAVLAEEFRARRGRKGDALAVAQLAGIQAVKHTATLIPLCHPLPIDGVDVEVRLQQETVEITAEVRCIGKTGVEMEALHAASVAALTVIDMGKSVQRDLRVQRIELLAKAGGERGDYVKPDTPPIAVCDGAEPTQREPSWPDCDIDVLTVSDRAAAGVYEDRSGPTVARWLSEHAGLQPTRTAVVPDDRDTLGSVLRDWCTPKPAHSAHHRRPHLLLTVGGTGLGPRDITPDVTASLLHRPHPGLTEHARRATARQCPTACLSRGVAGVCHHTLIVNLPGSPRGASEWLDALATVFPHALRTLAGADHASDPPPTRENPDGARS